MPDNDAEGPLSVLLAGNDRHVAGIDTAEFESIRKGQRPPFVSVCCSDSRVPQEGMWDISAPGTLFTVANIGNRALTDVDGETVLDGGVAYPVTFTGTGTVAIVGHTGCGAITAAYEIVTGETEPADLPPGVRADLHSLVERIESASIDLDGDKSAVVDRLVEHNVREQVTVVASKTDATVYGFVYDFHHRYGDVDGRTYLVAAGDAEPSDVVSEENRDVVRSLL